MSTRETSSEIATLAGRILSAGNPLDNEQVMAAIYEGLPSDLRPTHNRLREALAPALQPYFDNMLSLAGSCLSQAEDDEDENGAPRIALTAKVDWDKITNAIIGAFEGGSNYWLGEASYTYKPDGVEGNPLYAETDFWAKGGKIRLCYDDPDSDEGNRNGRKEIGINEIRLGLRSMATESPRHFGDLLSGNDDAETHDVFIQHVLFSEVIYG